MAKKWNKVIARIEALEDALAGLLSGRSQEQKSKEEKPKRRKPKKPARPTKAKPAKAAPARGKTAKAKKPRRAGKPRSAETVLVVPPAPLLAL